LDQIESFSQLFNDLGDLKEIVTVIGIPNDDESAGRRRNSSH
jgi:hypothetical protein